MRVIVCGGRDLANRDLVFRCLDEFGGITTVVHGGASGADSFAGEWAKARGVRAEVFRANWNKHGKAAGPIRNQEMANAGADYVIAFPGGRGTADMVQRAQNAKIPVDLIVPFRPTSPTQQP